MSNNKVTLTIDKNLPIDMDILVGTMGEKEIDIRNLKNHGYFTFDPGFTSTASCISKITYIDGDKGILLYRGFPIDQLVLKSNYMEVCYILLHGEIPNRRQYTTFCNAITNYATSDKQIISLFHGFNNNSHPMAIICGIICALSSFYHKKLDINTKQDREISAFLILSKIPIIVAMCHRYLRGQSFIYPRSDLSYTGNFLYMMFSNSYENYTVNPILEHALDSILILHADHAQNVSTSTVRFVGSSGTNLFTCIAAGIASLWGPAHGGANEACLHMLEKINKVEDIPKFIQRAKDKNDSFRLMGFGHRIYKNYDPRAIVMRDICHSLLKKLNISNELLLIAMELERIALHDAYFIEHKLYPNVDFYSGIILKAIGIPSTMFTVIFAMARTIGWIANWKEMHDNGLKIARPHQLYTGYNKRNFKSKINK